VIDLIPIIVLAPLAAFVINTLFGSRMKGEWAGWIATIAVFISFIITAGLFFDMMSRAPEDRAIHYTIADWIHVGRIQVNIAFLIDQLSIVFMLVITGVGTLIHLYSIGYMKGDPGFWRFFVYLNLFIVMMLQLVMADNYLWTFLGWEGVGLCSYLLIGFWFTDPEKAAAAIIKIAGQENAPVHLLLGGDAYNRVLTRLDSLHSNIREMGEVTCSTDL